MVDVVETDDVATEMPKAVKKKGMKKKEEKQDSSPSTPVKHHHPPYMQMILHAIENLNERSGSSRIAIEKFIQHEYNIDKDHYFKTAFSKALKSGVENGSLKQIKQSYKKVAPKHKAKKTTPAKAQNKPEAKEKEASTPKHKKSTAKPKIADKPMPAEKSSPKKGSNKKATNSNAPKKAGRPKKTADNA